MTTTPKRRGRQPGPPKPPKEPKRMGRPPLWPESLRPTGHVTKHYPLILDKAIQDPGFKEKLTGLMLDFQTRS